MATNPEVHRQSAAHRRVRRSMIFAGATVLLVTGGVGGASAASSPEPPVTPTPTITPTATPTGFPTETPTVPPTEPPTEPPTVTPSPTPPAVKVPPPGAWAFSGTPHGEFVVGTKDPCVFVTVLSQTGEATAVAEGSITVRSADGFEKVYVVDDTTKIVAGGRGNSDVRQGDWVAVTSAAGTENASAAYVYDLSRPAKKLWRGKAWWDDAPQWHWRWGKPGKFRTPEPCPTPTGIPTPTGLPTPTVTPTEPTWPPTQPPTPMPTGSEPPTEPPTAEPTVTLTLTETPTS